MKKAIVNKKTFLYDEEKATVYYVAPATEEEKKDNEEWQEKYGKNHWPLWDFINHNGKDYTIITYAGLSRENWKNKEAREEYLSEWLLELDEEIKYMI